MKRIRAPNGATLAALGLLCLAGIAKLPTLSQPLTENFAWRQTQTAWTALIYHQQGIDLLHPQVPVHGPPWLFGYEFPLFQAFGALLMDVGLPPDLAMRSLGLITFLITGWLLFRILARLAGSIAAVAGLTAFLFSPFGLLWGRTSLIEYLATAAALAFLLAGIRWLEDRRPIDYGIAMTAGMIALLVKITTGAFYLIPLLAYRSAGGRWIGIREWPLIGLIAIPAIVGRAWIAYTDEMKAASPATEFHVSERLLNYTYGTLEMRVDPEILLPIVAAILVGLTGAGLIIWLPSGIAYLRQLPQRFLLATLLVLVLIGPPLILTPLYSSQNYYVAAISPAAAMLVGLGTAWAWGRRRALIGRVGLASGWGLWVITLVLTRELWMMSYQPVVDRDGSLAAAAFIRERTNPDDWVVVDGRGWDPTVLYYARRRGYMLDELRGVDSLERLRGDERYTLFVDCPYEAECHELTP